MAWKLKGNIWGYNLEPDLDNFKLKESALQEIYDLRLTNLWAFKNKPSLKQSADFIYNALRFLPLNSFIIFNFDKADKYFVQFLNEKGNLVLNFPAWKSNELIKLKSNLLKILDSIGFTKSPKKIKTYGFSEYTIINSKSNKDKINVLANFSNDYLRAAAFTMHMANSLFNINEGLTSYYSHTLQE